MMKAALEEYNSKVGPTNNQTATINIPHHVTSTDMAGDDIKRRRGATVIGSRDYKYQPTIGIGGGGGMGSTTEQIKEDESYNSIKMRYLRSLNISIQQTPKDAQISASAPIPIPIALASALDDSDIDSEVESEKEDDDFTVDNHIMSSSVNNAATFLTGTFINGHLLHKNTLSNNSNNINSNSSNSSNNSSSNNSVNNSSNNIINNNQNNNTEDTIEIVPVRKDSRKHKFIPPHELSETAKDEDDFNNHSLPGNHRRKVFGQ
ncbi:hypothetical protein CYY_002076 [Polysphondylium violaceum]|uniref:Uncharacterized protein n=1 Tax=Polysphondylium violaceum TaxID=133409 RepID=A0A8J4V121_9MYCE|nr:hypothetical protein CYY_002076 [Polysphondylium violaceum]